MTLKERNNYGEKHNEKFPNENQNKARSVKMWLVYQSIGKRKGKSKKKKNASKNIQLG